MNFYSCKEHFSNKNRHIKWLRTEHNAFFQRNFYFSMQLSLVKKINLPISIESKALKTLCFDLSVKLLTEHFNCNSFFTSVFHISFFIYCSLDAFRKLLCALVTFPRSKIALKLIVWKLDLIYKLFSVFTAGTVINLRR